MKREVYSSTSRSTAETVLDMLDSTYRAFKFSVGYETTTAKWSIYTQVENDETWNAMCTAANNVARRYG